MVRESNKFLLNSDGKIEMVVLDDFEFEESLDMYDLVLEKYLERIND